MKNIKIGLFVGIVLATSVARATPLDTTTDLESIAWEHVSFVSIAPYAPLKTLSPEKSATQPGFPAGFCNGTSANGISCRTGARKAVGHTRIGVNLHY